MQRRTLVSLAAAAAKTLAASAVTGVALAQDRGGDNDQQQAGGDLGAALRRYLALPGAKSYLIHAGQGGSLGRIAHRPNLSLFTASAYKTFVLGQYLRDVEAGRLSLDEQLVIDDSVRMFGSPVFMNLSGSTQARSVLDAMIAYSDNTATDLATGKVGADRVRALIAQAGLSSIRIPASTRIFFSYITGAAPGADFGWPGIVQAVENPPGPLRQPLNDVITLAGNARDFVSWYEQALAGAFFAKPETLARDDGGDGRRAPRRRRRPACHPAAAWATWISDREHDPPAIWRGTRSETIECLFLLLTRHASRSEPTLPYSAACKPNCSRRCPNRLGSIARASSTSCRRAVRPASVKNAE